MTKNFLKRNEKHRAVAPIIATLIMVAIAVVGGVMVYVFTQGFFTGTQTQAPTTEAIQMTGYDAREVAATTAAMQGVTGHTGVGIAGQGDADLTVAANAGKIDGEEIAVHLKNLGTSDVSLNKVEVNFVQYSSGLPTAGTQADISKYAILDTFTAAGVPTTASSLAAGQERTLILAIDGPISNGATIPVEITTGSGSVFTFHVTVGQRE